MKLDFLKELYFHEWERKQQIANAAELPVFILTALVSGAVYLVRSFKYGYDAETYAFVPLIVVGLSFQGIAIFKLLRSRRGHWYQRLADTVALRSHSRALTAYYEEVGEPDGAEGQFEEDLADRLAEATDANREVNRRTAESLEQALDAIVRALIFTALAFVPQFAQSITTTNAVGAPAVVSKMEGGSVAEEGKPQEQPASTEPAQPQQQQPAARPAAPPAPPPNQLIPNSAQVPQRPAMPANQEVRKGEGVREKQ